MIFILGAAFGLWPIAIVATDAFVIGYLIFVCLFSWGSFKLIEQPAQAWVRGRLLGTRKKKPLISAP